VPALPRYNYWFQHLRKLRVDGWRVFVYFDLRCSSCWFIRRVGWFLSPTVIHPSCHRTRSRRLSAAAWRSFWFAAVAGRTDVTFCNADRRLRRYAPRGAAGRGRGSGCCVLRAFIPSLARTLLRVIPSLSMGRPSPAGVTCRWCCSRTLFRTGVRHVLAYLLPGRYACQPAALPPFVHRLHFQGRHYVWALCRRARRFVHAVYTGGLCHSCGMAAEKPRISLTHACEETVNFALPFFRALLRCAGAYCCSHSFLPYPRYSHRATLQNAVFSSKHRLSAALVAIRDLFERYTHLGCVGSGWTGAAAAAHLLPSCCPSSLSIPSPLVTGLPETPYTDKFPVAGENSVVTRICSEHFACCIATHAYTCFVFPGRSSLGCGRDVCCYGLVVG